MTHAGLRTPKWRLPLVAAAALASVAALPPEMPEPDWTACHSAFCADVPILARTPSKSAFEPHEDGWAGPGPYRHFIIACPEGTLIEEASFVDSDESDCAQVNTGDMPFEGKAEAYFRVDFDDGQCPAFHTTLRLRCR